MSSGGCYNANWVSLWCCLLIVLVSSGAQRCVIWGIYFANLGSFWCHLGPIVISFREWFGAIWKLFWCHLGKTSWCRIKFFSDVFGVESDGVSKKRNVLTPTGTCFDPPPFARTPPRQVSRWWARLTRTTCSPCSTPYWRTFEVPPLTVNLGKWRDSLQVEGLKTSSIGITPRGFLLRSSTPLNQMTYAKEGRRGGGGVGCVSDTARNGEWKWRAHF